MDAGGDIHECLGDEDEFAEFKLSLDTEAGVYAENGTSVGDGGLVVAAEQVAAADEGDKAETVTEEEAASFSEEGAAVHPESFAAFLVN